MRNTLLLLGLLAAAPAAALAQVPPAAGGVFVGPLPDDPQLTALVAKAPVILEGAAGDCNFNRVKGQLNYIGITPVTVYKVFKGEVTGTQVIVVSETGGKGEVGLNQHPTGLFFLRPALLPDLDFPMPQGPVFWVVDGDNGFFEYESLKVAEAWSPRHHYPRVSVDLYPAIEARTGQPYRVMQPFDPENFNSHRAQRRADSLMYAQGQQDLARRLALQKKPPKPTPRRKPAPKQSRR